MRMFVDAVIFILSGIGFAALLAATMHVLPLGRPARAHDPDAEAAGRKELLDRIVTLVGGVFAFLLGFVIVTNLGIMNTARQTTVDEANGLSQIYSAAHELPQPEHTTIRTQLQTYVMTVIHTEWPLMAEHELSGSAWQQITTVRDEIYSSPEGNPRVTMAQGQMLAGLNTAVSARRSRAMQAAQGMPACLWWLLITFGAILLLMPVLKGIAFTRTNMAYYLLFGGLIGLALWFVFELNYPFSGGLTVHPDAFTLLLQQWTPPSQ
jgi:hypothetical protein